MVNDGWHVCHGRDVYVKNGYVLRAMKEDRNGRVVSAAVYRWDMRLKCWVNVYDTRTFNTVRRGLIKGTYKVM
jgi:hypothetical protein